MKAFLDSSVTIPWFIEAHENNAAATALFDRIRRGDVQAVMDLHAVAETYSVVSTYPLRPPVSEEGLRGMIEILLDGRVEVLALTEADYREALLELADAGARGGIAYDALHVAVARRSGSDVIYTFDVRDFRRLAPDLAGRIREP